MKHGYREGKMWNRTIPHTVGDGPIRVLRSKRSRRRSRVEDTAPIPAFACGFGLNEPLATACSLGCPLLPLRSVLDPWENEPSSVLDGPTCVNQPFLARFQSGTAGRLEHGSGSGQRTGDVPILPAGSYRD